MDTSGLEQIGKFGTLSLLKTMSPKQLSLAGGADTVITSFGIDTEELTFGRDPKCSVRLYYPDVALLHCKMMFQDRKAFLAVHGETGAIVDRCEVFPKSDASPTIVPISNNSEFQIHGKRFRFTYPPKEMRAELFAAPSPVTNRKLRLSMIQSAQVFSPRPSNDPRENLRILQSPLKNQFRSPSKPSALSRAPFTPLKQSSPTPQRGQPSHAEDDDNDNDKDEEEDEIVLVDGNHPRVVQEDRDLVILEDVAEEELGPPSPVRMRQTIPEGTFKYVPWSEELEDNLACGIPVDLSTNEWKDKKVVLFSVPGAFTPTCHTKHLPPYLEKYDEFKSKGVDVIAVLAANDPFVMSGWARFEGLKDKILALSDTNAEWSKKLGLTKDLSAHGLGLRTNRYALILENNVVKYIGVETGPGVSVSGADAVLAHL